MKQLVAFDLDGTLAESKQPLGEPMGEALADLLDVAHVAVISGGDWPQFDKQVASRLPERADRTKLWLMPTTGTKLYTYKDGSWTRSMPSCSTTRPRPRSWRRSTPRWRRPASSPNRPGASGSRIAAARSPSPRSASRRRSTPRNIGTPSSRSARSSRRTSSSACRACRSTWAARPRSTSPARASTRHTA